MADSDVGSQAFGAGVAGGIDAWDKAYQNGKIADSMVKVNPELLDKLGMTPSQFSAQSAQDKSSAIAGIFQAQGAQQHAQLLQAQLEDIKSQATERTARNNYFNSMAGMRTDAAANDAGTGQLISDALSRMGAGNPPPGGIGPTAPSMDALTALSQAAQANPKIGGRSLAPAIDALTKLQSASVKPAPGSIDMSPLIGDGPFGTKLVTDRKSGSTQVVQSPQQVAPQVDEDGNTVGYSVPNGKGGFTFRPTAPKITGQLKGMLGPDGQPIYGMGVDEKGNAHNFLENLKADPNQPNSMEIANSSRNLANYLGAAAKGVKTASVDDSGAITKANPLWGGTAIKDLINGETTKLNALKGGNTKLSGGAAATGATKVRVIGPDGKTGNIPASQLQEALQSGYKQIQ